MDKETTYRFADLAAGLDPFVLIPALVQATGDEDLLRDAMPYAMEPDRSADALPVALMRRIEERTAEVLSQPSRQAAISGDTLRAMADFATGQAVPEDYVQMLLEEAGIVDRAIDQLVSLPPADTDQTPLSVAIVGAGVFAIALGVYLKRAGVPFVIYEKSEGLGGTWTDSRYPGCGVDTASHLYVYSFALNPDWPRYFSKQKDVLGYLERVVDRFGLAEHMRFGITVDAARYDEAGRRWTLTARTRSGEQLDVDASVLVSCVGQLNVPSKPAIPGLESFDGPVVHTARWSDDVSVNGKRVALIGAAASAVQLGPTIAPEVRELTVFQRSPQWLSFRPNYHLPVDPREKLAFQAIPRFINWYRLSVLWQFGDRLFPALLKTDDGRPSTANDDLRKLWEAHIRNKLQDRPDLLKKALPDFPPLTKRVPVDFGWLDMLKQDNVQLVTERIECVTRDAIITADGAAHPADLIVLATGYQATRMLQTIRIEGRDGCDLQEKWHGDDARAYLGMAVPGFPNFFTMYGPNTNLGHGGSLMFQAECQARYIVTAIRAMTDRSATEIECRPEVFDTFNDELDRQMERTVWTTPGVTNWFKNSRGRIVTNWPWSLQSYWQRTHSFVPSEYVIL